LHYPALYVGIWEYLRKPPTLARKNDAQEYLASLLRNTVHPNYDSPRAQLQRDRILWVRAWLASLAERENGEINNINNIKNNFNNLSSPSAQVELSSIRALLLEMPWNPRDSSTSSGLVTLPVPVPLPAIAAPTDIPALPDPQTALLTESTEGVVGHASLTTVVHALGADHPLLTF
jgi:hypothetical protein